MPTATSSPLRRIQLVTLPSTDQDRSVEFYEKLGFEKRNDGPWGNGYRWVELYPPNAPTGIALVPPGPSDPTSVQTGIIFNTDDIDATHAQLQPRNVVVRGHIPIGLIDWEQARPGLRVEDVAKLCWSFVEPTRTSDPVEIGERWRQIVNAYGLERADILVSMMLSQMRACADDIEREMARGSLRHQALAARGDHVALRAMHAWTVANELTLRKIIGA